MSRLVICSLCSLIAAAGCGDNRGLQSETPDTPDAGGDNIVTPGIGIAVVNSDYTSTSISLLDASTGKVKNGDCINSGTQTPGNTLALSGDVAIASAPQAGHLLVVIDHTNGALTWIDTTSCEPKRQLDVTTGFYSNPHDVISISETKAYVTRYDRNTAPTANAGDFDEGDDLLIIDPSVPAITGRIDLSSYATPVTGKAMQARPDRALLVEDTLFVVLQNLSDDFQTAAAGRIAVVDTATDQVTGVIDLPELKNCGSITYVDATKTLMVACGGSFYDADQAASSGVAFIDVSSSPPAMTKRQAAKPYVGRPVAGFSGIARDGAVGFAVTFGDYNDMPADQFWAFNTAAGTANLIIEAKKSYTFGSVLVDTGHERVYLTDANAAEPRVHSFGYSGSVTLESSINANPTIGLPPRELAWY